MKQNETIHLNKNIDVKIKFYMKTIITLLRKETPYGITVIKMVNITTLSFFSSYKKKSLN